MSRSLLPALVAACAAAALPGVAEGSTWSGTTYEKVQRSNRVVAAGYTAHGDVWFHVGRRGAVRGRAVVAYEGSVDTARINAFASYVRDIGGAALGFLPLLGPYVSTLATADIIGVNADFDQPAEVHAGAIGGTLRGGRLSLHWANSRPKGLPVQFTLAAVHGDKPLTHGSVPVESPWRGTARVAGGGAVATFQGSRKLGGATLQRSGYWTAHRVR